MVIEIKWINNCFQVFLLPMFVISCYSMNKLYFPILLRKRFFDRIQQLLIFSFEHSCFWLLPLQRYISMNRLRTSCALRIKKRFSVKKLEEVLRSKRSFGVNKSYQGDFRFQWQFNRWMVPDLFCRWLSTVRVWMLATYLTTDPGQWRRKKNRIPLVSLIYHLFSTFVRKILSLWAFRRLFSVLCALCWFMRFQVRPRD